MRRLVGFVALVGLLGPIAVIAASSDRPVDRPRAAKPAESTERFLALTADGEVPANGLQRSARARTTAADADAGETDCAAEDLISANVPADPGGLLPDKPTGIMPNGWCIRPAGRQVDVLRFPLGLAPSPDESKVVVSSDNGGLQGLTLIDAETLTPTTAQAANLFMGVNVADDGTVWASGGNANRLFRWKLTPAGLVALDATEFQPFPIHNGIEAFQARGGREPQALPVGDGLRVSGYPGPMVRDDNLLYVAGTLSEATGEGDDACPGGQQACGRVTIIDVTTGAIVRRVPVGLDAIGLELNPERDILYVANWADEAGRGAVAGGGAVSVVDISVPATAHEVAWVPTGHHPAAVQISGDGNRLFVANTNDDTISIYDISGDRAVAPVFERTDSVSPIPGVPVGAHPDAFALSPDGSKLFVALAGINAIEVRDGLTGAQSGIRSRYIPTGWYPSALLVTGTADDYRLWVTNAKGTGPGPGVNLSVGWNGNRTNGSVSVIDFPAADETAAQLTEAVFENDRFDDAEVDPCDPGEGVRVSEVLCPADGLQSPIKHVVYLVTENKTFDQYFGDLPASDGWRSDPKWILYPEPITPNRHAMAPRYSLGDNFFSDAEVSVTGHSWTSGAIATEYNERTWEADYDEGIRGSHGNGDPLRPGVPGTEGGAAISGADRELEDPEGGYIFEAFRRAGAVPPADASPGELSMAIYGEGTARTSEFADWSTYQAPDWKKGDIQYFDTCRALQFINGEAPDGPAPTFSAGATLADCEGRTLPEQFTLENWIERFPVDGDVMPSFIYMTLPVNHTLGTNLGSPTPTSMVADNDYAVGLIVEALSKSPFWDSTVVIQTEDDTQAAGDHISALRDYVLVASPWAEPGPNHQWGSLPSILRTVEVLFGVEPISLFDRLAIPLHEAFQESGEAPGAPGAYTAIRPNIPFAVNEPGATASDVSESMDWSTYDRIDEATLNAILYTELRGWPLRLPEHAGG